MNKQRRKKIARAIKRIEEAVDILEKVKEEEEEAYNNLPEPIQYSERGEEMEQYIDILDSKIDDIYPIISELREI